MRKIVILTLLYSLIIGIYAQHTSDIIDTKKTCGTVKMYRNGMPVNILHAKKIMKDNPTAYNEINLAYQNYTGIQFLSFLGGGLIGWPIGQYLGGAANPAWELAAIGTGMVLLCIPLNTAYNKHVIHAVRLYNQQLQPQSNVFKPLLYVGVLPSGIGLQLRF
jgi:hypothetical protein